MSKSLGKVAALLGFISASLMIVFAMGMKPAWSEDYKPGLYVGGLIGYDAAKSTANVVGNVDFAQQGAIGTVVVGYTWAYNSVIWGLEGDLSLSGLKGGANDFGSLNFSNDVSGSLRGRVGLAIGPALPFVTAGVAFARPQVSVEGLSASAFSAGFVGGGGMDLQLSPHMLARIEGLYFAYPNKTFEFNNVGSFTADHSETVVRAGLLFRL